MNVAFNVHNSKCITYLLRKQFKALSTGKSSESVPLAWP